MDGRLVAVGPGGVQNDCLLLDRAGYLLGFATCPHVVQNSRSTCLHGSSCKKVNEV